MDLNTIVRGDLYRNEPIKQGDWEGLISNRNKIYAELGPLVGWAGEETQGTGSEIVLFESAFIVPRLMRFTNEAPSAQLIFWGRDLVVDWELFDEGMSSVDSDSESLPSSTPDYISVNIGLTPDPYYIRVTVPGFQSGLIKCAYVRWRYTEDLANFPR